MARKTKTKYHLRPDGRVEMTKTIDGVRVHFYGKSDAEVEKKYDDYRLAALRGEIKPKTRKFEAVADEWWEGHEGKLSPNTVCGYRTAKNRAVDAFGSQEVDSVTPQDVAAYLERFAKQGYSQKVISNSRSVLNMIFNHAFVCGDIRQNPCAGVPMPKGKKRRPRKPAPKEDIDMIEATKTESLFARMSYFMAYTGCRRGEAVALQQKDIDRAAATAHICKAVAYSDTRKPILKTPKTEAGDRYVDLLDNVLEILPQYDDDETFIFFPDGLPTKTQLETGLKKYQTAHGLKSTAHQLRHSYASLLHSAGVDVKDAQVQLGHSTVAMTQDIYTHLEEEHRREVKKQVNEYVKNRRGASSSAS